MVAGVSETVAHEILGQSVIFTAFEALAAAVGRLLVRSIDVEVLALIAAYGKIVGIPEENLVWTYLNKGTHEEANRDDFDTEKVEDVVQTLETLDMIELRRGR